MRKFNFCAGAIGFGIQQSVIPSLREFLLDLSPTLAASSQVLTEFWEDSFDCKLGKRENAIFIHFQFAFTVYIMVIFSSLSVLMKVFLVNRFVWPG